MIRDHNNAQTWQDIDDGIQLAKLCFMPVSKVLGILFIVLVTICLALSVYIESYWLVLIIWWLKPVYDRAILTVLALYVSRQSISTKKTITAAFRNIVNFSTIKDLTIRRINMTRSFKLPVHLLEKNEGDMAAKRFKVLSQKATASRAFNLTFIALMIEYVIVITIISMLVYLIPEELRMTIFDSQLRKQDGLVESLSFLFYFTTIFITEPLYVASGFNLYLRRRMRLEAWDIEQVFRTMVARNA